jgi:hypothetical protein
LKRVIYIALITTLLLLPFNMKAALASEAMVKIDPSTLQIDYPNQEFRVNVTVENVENVALWQIYIEFNATILECLNVSIPTENIFEGKTVIAPDPVIDNEKGTILYGATTFPPSGVSGSGTLCEIKFKSKVGGISQLHLVTYEEELNKTFCTKLEDPEGTRIMYTTTDGEITVVPESIVVLAVPALIIVTIATLILKRKVRKTSS